MKKLLFFVALLTACSTTPPPAPAPVPEPTPVPTPKAPDIDSIVVGSACSKYSWKNRGVAPIGYVKGMARVYSRAYCRLMSEGSARVTPASEMAQSVGDPAKDALALYGIKASTRPETLRKNFTMLIGLGMRETSGYYGTGRDSSATNTASNTAESGLFQVSYNMKDVVPAPAKAALQSVYSEYLDKPGSCMVDVFKEGSKKTFNTVYWSLPSESAAAREAGLKFQKTMRECPAFAAEYTAIGVRVRMPHWGPLKRKEAEYYQPCEDMLKKVEAAGC